ncbi:hypothetical protein SAMN05421846_10261 [Chryseobacterium taeanense]|uniref:DUF6876 domain-containing protein n=1 Tax=Chryseobacterium taeanense TaxID=311334 RepID=A0A1G8FA12_9FLAO|nr:DUF6876 family protein [Chryseobacterium taeanense]SDH78957.1 hypothetical protein SAMN05421846_10261 [Chryseobacterium taeanense]
MKNYIQSANDYYSHFVQPKDFVEFASGYLLSEGICRIAEEEQCFWLIQIICFQPKMSGDHFFESWIFKRAEGLEYILQAKDYDSNIIFEESFPSPDFFFSEIIIWKVGNYLLLPSEYDEFVKMISDKTDRSYCLNNDNIKNN